MKNIALFLLLIMGFGYGLAQECPYDPDLDWDDFREVPDDPNNDHDAVTDSGVKYEYSISVKKDGNTYKAKVKAKVSSVFNKGGSTVEKGAKTDELLQHEQYHLDISEYWARQLQEALDGVEQSGATAQDAADFAGAEAQRIIDRMMAKCDDLQEQYDDETEHSQNKAKQAEWCKKIEAWLNPPKVETPKGTSEKTGMMVNPEDGGFFLPPMHLASFSFNNQPFIDPIFQNALVEFPVMYYGGDRMGIPYFYTLPYEDVINVIGQDGQILMSGVIRLMMGDGADLTYTAWLAERDPEADELESPFLDAIEQTAGNGRGITVVSLVFSDSPTQATNGWTAPAFLEAHVELGVSKATNPCDVNCDGRVDFQDQEALMAILAGESVVCSHNGGDLNGDGEVNDEDYFLLEDCVMGPDPDGVETPMKTR